MKTNLFIPQKIKVGFQNRDGTYTGQLAYVIYYDQKGKLRKETSWENWRDKKIEPAEYENVPTEGFVLNKKVGGYVSDWNFRQTYVRVYDPRGFEFEITVPNLLYILENTSSIKGKGLEGKFLYAWDGTDLVLLPECAPEYKVLTELNEKRFHNATIKAKDLKIGATYLTSKNETWIYMGRFDYYDYAYVFDGQTFPTFYKMQKYAGDKRKALYHSNPDRLSLGRTISDYKYEDGHCIGQYYYFACGDTFHALQSVAGKLIDTISAEPVPNYAELFEKLESDKRYSPYDASKDQYVPSTLEEFSKVNCWGSKKLIRIGNEYKVIEVRPAVYRDKKLIQIGNEYKEIEVRPAVYRDMNSGFQCYMDSWPWVPPGMHTKPDDGNNWGHPAMVPASMEEIFRHVEAYHRDLYLANGKFWRREY